MSTVFLLGLGAFLLIVLALLRAHKWHQALMAARLYRTASGRKITRDCRVLLQRRHTTMPSRKGEAGAVVRELPQLGGRIARDAAACAFADRFAGIVSPNPYRPGSKSFNDWADAYRAARPSYTGTVQTTARSPVEA